MRLLFIEDDMKVAMAVKRGFDAEGFAVDAALSSADGMERAIQGGYDALIVGLTRDQSGVVLCAQLRSAQIWTPILALTATADDRSRVEALDAGADDVLAKPFALPVAIARLRALLRRTSGQEPEPIQVGDLRLDPGRRRTWRGGEEVPLTARQFEVLEFLMRRAGQVLSKNDILAGVWPYDFHGDANIVEVYIRRLRSRIDEPFGCRAIETVRGAGYRVAPDGGGPSIHLD